MHAPWTDSVSSRTLRLRAARLAVAASFISVSVSGLTGCKRPVEQADQTLSAQLTTAEEKLAAEPKKIETILPSFQQASNVSGASDTSRATAKIALASVEQQAADRLVIQAEQKQAEVYQISSLLNQNAARIVAGTQLDANYQALEPKVALEAIAKQGSGAESGAGDDKAWIPGESSAIPSLAAVKAQQASNQEKIDKLLAQQKDLQSQRQQAITLGEKLRNQSEAATGKKSLDYFTQASAQTKKAADISAQLETIANNLLELQQDQALAQAQQKQLEAALASVAKQKDDVTKGWSDIQALMKSNDQYSQSLLDGSSATSQPADDASATPASQPTTHPTSLAGQPVAALLALMQQRVEETQKLRQAALVHLDAAKKALGEATKLSDTVRVNFLGLANKPELQTQPQLEAWRSMIDVHNASSNKLLEALLWQRYARLYADWAETAAARALGQTRLEKSLSVTKLTAPASLDSKTAAGEADESQKLADEAFGKVESILADIQQAPAEAARGTGGTSLAKSAKDVAQTLAVVALYAHGQFDASMSQHKDGDAAATDRKNADDLISKSKAARDTALANNIALPVLPLELLPPPVAVGPTSGPSGVTSTTGPSTNPAGAPTSEPGGATTQPNVLTGETTTKPDAATPPTTAPETPAAAPETPAAAPETPAAPGAAPATGAGQ